MSVGAALGIILGVPVVFGWLLSLIRNDGSVVDPLWEIGFMVAAAAMHSDSSRGFDALDFVGPALL